MAALFFTNGALYANVVPRYPEIKAGLELSGAAFGSAIGAYGLGALLVGLSGGALVARWGSAVVAPASTLVIAANLVLVGAAPAWLALAVALFVAGSLDAVADVANNAHALRVERRYGRSILNSLHAVWSIGAVTGAAMGSLAVGLGAPVVGHLAVVAGLLAVVPLTVRRLLL
ncbi:MAG: MFS transporter, partial [Actinomycetota bacterium]|nr:MFS transporter [Actinomycetota bacterium]